MNISIREKYNSNNLFQCIFSVKHTDVEHILLERVLSVLKTGKDDNEDHRITLKKFDWDKVSFDDHSAEDCKRFCLAMIRPVNVTVQS